MDGQLTEERLPVDQADYVLLSERGKNEWWRYLIAIILILWFWLIMGSVPYLAVLLLRLETDPLWNFTGLMATYWFLLIGLWAAVRLVHQRRFRTLITPARRIDWKRVLQGFGVWFGLSALTTLADYLVRPDFYTYTFQPSKWLPFALLALVLVPLQTSSEELLFRGYLVQWLGRILHTKVALVLLSGFFFALPHFVNPEMQAGFTLMAAYYFLTGAFLAWITLMDNKLELALGVHAANNLFAALAVNYEGSVLTTPAIYVAKAIDPLSNLLTFVVQACFLLIIFFMMKGLARRRARVGKRIE
jgi:membrane protease YdiL (CAAX protease family)